ncbi:hypothetical protein P168DRAFT_288110 [Aspergillus campestris IBT 28561]|uniref:HNH nuclease domain-containing protein n=1 Tax=Aspergillus campestris (strain IBT 28561) TaxID=1392248 RepID=A0A2I1D8G9_ASPC2|nr:uncharacterized protein P168DRAFT_288110 [Aspergillus campestris IBT 28561]PKY06148.1 hypothetical protein P168DRAFT_288110 [Aspergillus campestris IBT 28561]
MDIAPEFLDARRLALVEQLDTLVAPTKIGINTSTWACLWLSDIGKLQKLVDLAKSAGSEGLNGVVSQLTHPDVTSTIRNWSTTSRPRDEDNSKKRGSDGMASPQPLTQTKIPRLSKAEPDVTTGTGTSSSVSTPPVKQGSESPAKRARSRNARKACLERDQETCVITKAGEPLEVAHIYPYSLGQREADPSQFMFWRTLGWFWTDEKIQAWKSAVLGPQGTETCSNMLCLGSNVHGLWGMARFSLKPIEISEDKKTLKVKFFWLPNFCFSRHVPMTACPKVPQDPRCGPKNTKLWDCDTEKIIESGEEIILRTDDPEVRPLPSVELLEMQWILNRVNAISGAADIPEDELDPDRELLFGKIPEEGLLDEDSSEDELS